MLGVSPATLRRWSDAGRLRVFTTAGGHRRFSRAALERLLPADRSRRPSLGSAGLTATCLARSYRRARRQLSADLPWVLAMTDDQRALFRERGQLLAMDLLEYLDAPTGEAAAHHFSDASATAAEQGRAAAALGLSLSQTIEGFLRFRAPFHHELAAAARRSGFDTAETAALLEAAERAMDQLLVATMTGHGRAAPGQTRQPHAAAPRPAAGRRTSP